LPLFSLCVLERDRAFNAMSQQNLGNPLLASTYQKMEPFLWIHLALLAAVPLAVVLCMMGLAVGDPVFPGWLEMLALGIPPIALTVWLQWQNPLYPFSLWVLAKPANELSDNQRRVLSILRRRINGWYIGAWIAVVAGLFMYVVFRQIYITAPLAADMAPFPPVLRLLGILWAEIFFLIANLLWQMGVAAARVILVPPSEFNSLAPYEVDRISKEFTIVGKRSPDLLSLEPLAPIQQTAELITEPDASEPASTNPLLAQLSSLIDKVTAFLPSRKSATVEKPAPVSSPQSRVAEEIAEAEEVAQVEESKKMEEVAQVEGSQGIEEMEEIAQTEEIEATDEVEEIVQAEEIQVVEEIAQTEKPEEIEVTEEVDRAKEIVTVDTLTADLRDASTQSAETVTPTESAAEHNENIGTGETIDAASNTAIVEETSQSDRPDVPNPNSDDEEWV
jgi:hypothetical protein